MVEADLNTILVRSINTLGGKAEKLVDPSYADLMRGARKVPYDYYGTLPDGRPIHSESKLVKPQTTTQMLSSFSFKKIEDHQFENLNAQASIRNRNNRDTVLLYSIGYWKSRKYFIVFFFDVDYIRKLKAEGKTSFTGKEMQEFYDKGLYLEIKKKHLDFNKIDDVIIS